MILAAALLAAGLHTQAQTRNYDTLRDMENKQLVYKGSFALDDLNLQPAFDWMKTGVAAYTPDAAALQYLKANLARYKLVVFMGTWCDDSQNLVPKLYKILKEAGYPVEQVTLYGVDRAKTTGTEIEQKYKVLFVPSIIVLDGDKEKGRITENVDKSVEADLRHILEQ